MHGKELPRSWLHGTSSVIFLRICTVDAASLQIYRFRTTPSVVIFTSNSTDNFGDTDPFFDESAEQHQWKPEPSEDALERLAEDSGTSGEFTDHPEPESLPNLHEYEEVSSDSQSAPDDDSGENRYESDAQNGDHSPDSSFGEEDTQDERAEHDAGTENFFDNTEKTLGDSSQEGTGTVYESLDKYCLPPEGFTESSYDDQQVDNDPNHSPEQTHSADPSTVAHTPTTQHNDHPNHKAEPKDIHKQPEPTPTLDAVAQGNTTLNTGHEGNAVREIQAYALCLQSWR
jgi:hypothetical protein